MLKTSNSPTEQLNEDISNKVQHLPVTKKKTNLKNIYIYIYMIISLFNECKRFNKLLF